MRILAAVLLCLGWVCSVHAEEISSQSHHMATTASDTRQLVEYPPEVKAYALGNMRRHLEALAEIMDAFAKGQYALAADIADNKLGMDSSDATACRMDGDHHMMPMNETAHLQHQMGQLMPEKWRELGQNMHKSANEFAAQARGCGHQ